MFTQTAENLDTKYGSYVFSLWGKNVSDVSRFSESQHFFIFLLFVFVRVDISVMQFRSSGGFLSRSSVNIWYRNAN